MASIATRFQRSLPSDAILEAQPSCVRGIGPVKSTSARKFLVSGGELGSVCDVQLAEETFRQSLSLDKLVTRALLCRTELAFLQYSMRRLSSSSSWTPELQEHLEVLEELLRRESASAYFEMANLPAVSLVHLRAKADALRQLCGLDDTDLRGMLTRSLCDDVLALANCRFESIIRK